MKKVHLVPLIWLYSALVQIRAVIGSRPGHCAAAIGCQCPSVRPLIVRQFPFFAAKIIFFRQAFIMGKLLSCLLLGCVLSVVAGAKVLASLSCPPAHLTLLITNHLYGFPSFFFDALASLGFLLVSQWVINVFGKVTEFIQLINSCSSWSIK